MCGIVGVVGSIYAREEAAFKILCKLDTVRGEDSTGICSVTKDFGDWATLKDVGTPFELFNDKGFTEMMKRNHAALFGHNRAATKGAVTIENAHPFRQGDFIGCHNGTLHTVYNLKDHQNFKVDSENIFHNMEVEGVTETLKKLNGAFTLCWYNSKLHTISLVRNKERPMYYCYAKDNKTIFWASESWMIHVALEKVGIARREITELEVGKLFTVHVPVVAGVQINEIKDTQEDVEFYKIPVFRGEGSVYWGGYSTKTTYPLAKKDDKKDEKEGNVIQLANKWAKGNMAQRFLSKTVIFSVIGKRKKGNLEYILCEIEEEGELFPEIRVFTPYTGPLGMDLLTSPDLFSGRVKGCTSYGDEAYLVCDNRTITPYIEDMFNSDEIVDQSDDDFNRAAEEETITGFDGRVLSLAKYLELTSGGCACCGDISPLKDAPDLMWISGQDYFCPECKKTQLADQYRSIQANK